MENTFLNEDYDAQLDRDKQRKPETASWPDPESRYLKRVLPAPPRLPLEEVFGPRWSPWIRQAAEGKAAPADYIVGALLSAAGSLIGNARWASPWSSWQEPPIIWSMLIGSPSSSKSPSLDAILAGVRHVESAHRRQAEARVKDWDRKAKLAKMVENAWKDAVKAAMNDDEAPPERPAAASAGPKPHIPRLILNDGTIERIAVLLSQQPRGTLQARDELAGFLGNMARYSSGGSDRPFWLEAYGGRGYTVERISREPVTIERLSIGVVGAIQPDRLKTLLLKVDDDGLLARFIPIWPEPAPVTRPSAFYDRTFLNSAFERLFSLQLFANMAGEHHPLVIPFSEEAARILDEFRHSVRAWEAGQEGLLSFIGKLPGLAVRLSLVLAYLDWSIENGVEPSEISVVHFARAARLTETYILPMAKRAYAEASIPDAERKARSLVSIIIEQGWQKFTTREVLRLERAGLRDAKQVDAAVAELVEGYILQPAPVGTTRKVGRPTKLFFVNPALHRGRDDTPA